MGGLARVETGGDLGQGETRLGGMEHSDVFGGRDFGSGRNEDGGGALGDGVGDEAAAVGGGPWEGCENNACSNRATVGGETSGLTVAGTCRQEPSQDLVIG